MNADVMQSRSETLEIGQAYFKNIYPFQSQKTHQFIQIGQISVQCIGG